MGKANNSGIGLAQANSHFSGIGCTFGRRPASEAISMGTSRIAGSSFKVARPPTFWPFFSLQSSNLLNPPKHFPVAISLHKTSFQTINPFPDIHVHRSLSFLTTT
ncbi:hypothetical protein L596_019081 [Steinernema carpocapsae]|uniref:Uncharacterized protein n=1 Tax=Steinernema carpocapsae TaxID=34508 RepID=A0A4U5N7I9_STECR|nr:hypothetical protein L596_019081 [Steinernema carpocapsae]